MPDHPHKCGGRCRLLSPSITRSVVLSFLLISLVPISILGFKVYQAAWNNAWREINEKHRLLAMNLASPISIYINDHRHMLGLLAKTIEQRSGSSAPQNYSQLLGDTVDNLKDFRSLILVGANGHTLAFAGELNASRIHVDDTSFATEKCFIGTRNKKIWHMSGIKTSPMNGEPTIIMGQPVLSADGGIQAVLLGELRTELIERLRKNIKFGKMGHSAIVDKFGRVVAHPNPQWMREMRDLSDLPVVQKMLAGETGVTEFYSPFIKADMVAGFTGVPNIGWGVMVPQPKSEVEQQVRELLFSQLGWGAGGLALAALLAIVLARWITGPVNRLADAAQDLVNSGFQGAIPEMAPNAPLELRQLSLALKKLIDGLQKSRSEVEDLNANLQRKVQEATHQLREANQRLKEQAHYDHLTSLANRRQFEYTLANGPGRRESDATSMCILLIDVDHFKSINDSFGHAAGDQVLIQIAGILDRVMRHGDLVVRYGGDEFAACMHCSVTTGRMRAQEILDNIRNTRFRWQDNVIPVTVSIGLFHDDSGDMPDLETVLRNADAAMYEAKRKGRDCIVVLDTEEESGVAKTLPGR
jgi:diguanylate cyclase (GGDEF)-like protein